MAAALAARVKLHRQSHPQREMLQAAARRQAAWARQAVAARLQGYQSQQRGCQPAGEAGHPAAAGHGEGQLRLLFLPQLPQGYRRQQRCALPAAEGLVEAEQRQQQRCRNPNLVRQFDVPTAKAATAQQVR